MKTKIKASELKPLQRFWMHGEVHLTIKRGDVCGYLTSPGRMDGKTTYGNFSLMNDGDVLAVDLSDGSLSGIHKDTEVEVDKRCPDWCRACKKGEEVVS